MTTLQVPLRFRRLEIEKVWGGRALERCPGITLESAGDVGETWEIVDRPEEQVAVADGEFEGLTLGELVARHRDDLLGAAPLTPHGRFPLLVKYLDAQDNLSVQVHPDIENAPRVPGAEPKTEAWYFLAVERDSDGPREGKIYAGLKPETHADAFRRDAGTRAVLDHLVAHDAQPGCCLVVPGGTVHAIGGGVTLLEVQQNSDTTYRMWDWDRPRETHLSPALEVTRYDLPPRAQVEPVWESGGDGVRRAPMARTRTFAMNVLSLTAPARLSTANQFQIYAVERGAGRIETRQGASVELARGDVWLLPAAIGYHDLTPTGDEPLGIVQLMTKA